MMTSYVLVVPLILSFLTTLFLIPLWIARAQGAGIAGKDIHKNSEEKVAESGGVIVLGSFVLGVLSYVAIQTFVYGASGNILLPIITLLAVILMASFIGFLDDLLGWKIGLTKGIRLLLLIFCAIPLMVINAGEHDVSMPFVGVVDFGILYPLFLIPLAIVGTTTTYNFLAGFNGLEAGQGVIFLSGLAIVAFFTGNAWLSIIALCMIASLIAFLAYNYTPAKVFPGDSMMYAIGALISVMAILGNFEKVALFFFIPYIIEVALKSRGKLVKESFGKLQEDGSIGLKYDKLYSLTHVAIYSLKKVKVKPTEKRVVLTIWGFQTFVILMGLLIFRNGIF